ncbi:MAG: DJ-1/PfpI family protein [Gammaproteobacteria bacterium]|nr:DJ-1/PfpI family protein [Gammaproteobacteria bacterium]MCW8841451.1 DJ-1/PfpI family protein [Gammaproteobacteria bacterium]MCW8958644.1 DJ-1/PfpI family protein [Gammaproteobacteria bacterium]MCW8971988.1 DJ-1/PfpI family protein [Gammaproteobacteria bacterium]MCW8991971.1 DJ-1/PfpI family protein [Gammaproteobacteria bacterium]
MARVLVPLAQGCEELEAVTIIDLLVRAGVEVVTAGLQEGPVTASRGVVLLPQTTLDEALKRDYDMVVLPGGMPGAEHLDNDPRIAGLLRKMADSGKFTAAICAAPRVLANAGLLAGKRATSYPGFVDKMKLPDVEYLQDAVVQDGKVITSRGPGTAMDFALTLIEQLVGREKRDEVEAGLVRC